MRILITGGSGLLGQYLNKILSVRHDILTLYFENTGNCTEYNSEKTDVTDNKSLKKIFRAFKPDVVIHTAAISRPELCDKLDREFVIRLNVKSTEYLTRLSAESDSLLIFTSTDLVYDGDKGGMLDENSRINPVSFYAETKVISEEIVRNHNGKFIILRTSLLYGIGLNHSVNNFHNTLMNFRAGKISRLFYDQFRTPLALHDAAEIIRDLISAGISGETLNFGGCERISRTGLGEVLCRAGNFDMSLIERISMLDASGLHKVADVSMNTDKLRSYGIRQRTIEESVIEILNNDV